MSSPSVKKIFAILLCALVLCQTAYASPWAAKESYGEKAAGKLAFGLKNSLLGWTAIFTEPNNSRYDLKRTEWEGLCNGIAKTLFYTGAGLLQLATFPVPVDIPNVGDGVLPNLGKNKGTPKPWEVHGRSKYRVTPADQVPAVEKESAVEAALRREASTYMVPAPSERIMNHAPAAATPALVQVIAPPSVPAAKAPAAATPAAATQQPSAPTSAEPAQSAADSSSFIK